MTILELAAIAIVPVMYAVLNIPAHKVPLARKVRLEKRVLLVCVGRLEKRVLPVRRGTAGEIGPAGLQGIAGGVLNYADFYFFRTGTQIALW